MSAAYWAVVPAAGVGKRMGADCPKQYLMLSGKPVIAHTLDRLLAVRSLLGLAVAVSPDDPYWNTLEVSLDPRIIRAEGGQERADSVLNALIALSGQADSNDWVLVHDAARPCVMPSDIERLMDTLVEEPIGGILALPVTDTLKTVADRSILGTADRTTIWRALTPQMFRYGALRQALSLALEQGHTVTDEASAMEQMGFQPRIVEGRPDNIKITRPEDLALATFYMESQC